MAGDRGVRAAGPSPWKRTCCRKEQVDRAVADTLSTFGSLDIVVNNAGITRDGLLLRMSEEDWDVVLDTNLKGAFLVTRAALKPMVKQRRGKIVNITSVIGLKANPGQANYSAAKAGLIGFTRTVAKEVSARNIQVNAVAPGFIETAITAELSPAHQEGLLKQIPAGRFGQPAEIAAAVAFLVRPERGLHHGADADGGWRDDDLASNYFS